MIKLQHRLLLCRLYSLNLIADVAISVLDKKQSFKKLRTRSQAIQDQYKSVYRIVYAVEVLRGLTTSQIEDVVNSLKGDLKAAIEKYSPNVDVMNDLLVQQHLS